MATGDKNGRVVFLEMGMTLIEHFNQREIVHPPNGSFKTIRYKFCTLFSAVIIFAVLTLSSFNLLGLSFYGPLKTKLLMPASRSGFEDSQSGEFNSTQASFQDFSRQQRGRRSVSDRDSYPTWEIDSQFKNDVFTFVRIQYDSTGRERRGGQWSNDYPDCDWNFSVRLHELTSIRVDPNGKVIRLTDQALFDHPFIYFSNINRMSLSESEVASLRKYLLKGGFMMADDFWAPDSWKHVYREMKRVFPDLEPRELSRDHEIFNIVYDIQGSPQVPSIFAWNQGSTFEYWHGDPKGDEAPHFWGFFDNNDRLMALLCHNNDIGDGWEREGENKEYFKTYSERVSYPLGINIVTYVMTH